MENPLLYKTRPPCSDPTFLTTQQWINPAIAPHTNPYSPATGAIPVQNNVAKIIYGSAKSHKPKKDAMIIPETIKVIFFGKGI